MNKYDVGIVGWWYNLNYGGVLTYYSLYKCIEKMGLNPLMIQRSSSDIINATETVPIRFSKKHYNISESYPYDKMVELNKICDKFIVGSDQLWNPNLMKYSGKQYFLSFVDKKNKKVSYATSLGDTMNCDSEFIKKYKVYLDRFDSISVRENYAVDVLKEYMNVNADCVCDPIFLNGVGIFDELTSDSVLKLPESNNYVLNFLLDPNEQKINGCRFVREKLGIEEKINFTNLQNVENNVRGFMGEDVQVNAEIEDLLKAYKNASFIVTDSFHGTCLALLFNKPFVSFANKKRGEKRFISLLEGYGLDDRLLFNIDNVYNTESLFTPIDYERINNIIDEKRKVGAVWLENALDIKYKTVANSNILCTGCSACQAICPTKAIKMQKNDEGFLVPVVDYDKCKNCGLCLKKCIVKNPTYDNKSTPNCYSLMADTELRMKSSSGGAFSVFAEYIIDQGGFVCGAAYTEKFEVKHIIINKKEELSKLRGSKYMQSEIGNIYFEIKKLLENNELVLFTGMPCQIAGIQAYLDKKYNNLYTVDLLCHGMTSSTVFEKYRKDVLANKEIERLEFKAKEPWGWHAGVNAYFKDGSKYSQPLEKDPFFIAYLRSISKNTACGECPSSSLPRQGDITIGDFWGIHKCDPEMFDNKGTSVVLVNNEKGQQLFELAHKNTVKVKEEKLSDAIKGNQPIKRPFKMHKYRDAFFKHMNEISFERLTDGCKNNTLAEKQMEQLRQVLSENEFYLYYLAKTTAENANGRKIVTWTSIPIFDKILRESFNLDVAFSVAENPNIINGTSIKDIKSLNGCKQEYYIVLIHPVYAANRYQMLEEMGYLPIEDFICRSPRPIVIENYDTRVHYEDEYGNTIEGFGSIIGKVIFRGCNNHIYIGENVRRCENLTLDLVANSYIKIEDECVFNDKVLVEVKGILGHSKLIVGNACRLSNGFFRIYNNRLGSYVEIGKECTFERNLEIHANSGKKIIIGDDCMISHDVEFWAGDGHSIFDVVTGENINAARDGNNNNDKIVIGNHVWIAKGSFIMHGTNIGTGSVIGARSVVKKQFPNNCSIAGNPAKVVRRDIAWAREQVASDMYKACGEENIQMTE